MFATKIRNLARRVKLGCGMVLLCCIPSIVSAQLLKDGSFEVPLDALNPKAGWTACMGDPDMQVLDGNGPGVLGIHTPPYHGSYYLGMVATHQGLSEAVGQSLALEAGLHYYGSIALFRSLAHQNWNGTGQIQLWGGNDCNTPAELLWSSGSVTQVDQWQEYTIAFTPLQNHAWISVMLALDAGSGEMTYVCLDALQLYNVNFGVDFLGFEATPYAHSVLLEWETVALEDQLRFEVEWSLDGLRFSTVGDVDAAAGASRFEFQHSAPQAGRQFYRLRTVDQGGHEKLSAVRQVVVTEVGIHVFPNPVVESVTVGTGDGDLLIEGLCVLDLHGRTVMALECSPQTSITLAIPPSLANGSYWLGVQVNGTRTVQRLLVHR